MKDACGREMYQQPVTAKGLKARGGFSGGAVRFVPKKVPR